MKMGRGAHGYGSRCGNGVGVGGGGEEEAAGGRRAGDRKGRREEGEDDVMCGRKHL